MSDFLDTVIAGIISTEGGYSNHPNDKGGPTMYGITQAVARNYGYMEAMEKLPLEVARKIYIDIYWHQPKFDQVALMSNVIAEELFDSGVNFGPRVPTLWFQRWLNAFNQEHKDWEDISTDGQIGLKTINAFRSFLARRGSEGEMVMLTALNCSQGARYLELTESREANESFVYGWLRNRVFNQLKETI